MDWLDAHAGSVQAIATLVLVVLTGYYAWVSRSLVRETHTMLQSSARMTLQSRMDRISELMLSHPELLDQLDAEDATGQETDARFHIANMLLAVFEEAYAQHALERSMPDEEWHAWVATADAILSRRYLVGYWSRARDGFAASFREFVDQRFKPS